MNAPPARGGFWQGYRHPTCGVRPYPPHARLAPVDAARWAVERWREAARARELGARIAAEGWERSLLAAVRQAHERGASEPVLAAVSMRSLRWVRRVLRAQP